MKGRFVALNLALAAAVVAVAWQAKARWDDARQKRESTLRAVVKPSPVPVLTAAPQPAPAAAPKYSDVAQKNLFSKDRDPNVVIDPPKPPEPPKPMPKLPVVYGVMGLPSGIRALMAEKSGDSGSPVKVGDSVGEFKLLALDMKKVTFQWQDKQITKDIDELVDRAGPQDKPGPSGGPQPAMAPSQQSMTAPRQAPPSTAPPPTLAGNPDIGGGGSGPAEKACSPNDSSPAGTVVDGYKKVLVPTPFGNSCRWIK